MFNLLLNRITLANEIKYFVFFDTNYEFFYISFTDFFCSRFWSRANKISPNSNFRFIFSTILYQNENCCRKLIPDKTIILNRFHTRNEQELSRHFRSILKRSNYVALSMGNKISSICDFRQYWFSMASKNLNALNRMIS